MSLEITLYAAGCWQGVAGVKGGGAVGRGSRTEAGQAFAARNVNIGLVDTHPVSVEAPLSPAIQFPCLISPRIFIIFKLNICDFAAFRCVRSWGRTCCTVERRLGRQGQSLGVNKLSMRRVEHVVVVVAALGAFPTAERVVRKIWEMKCALFFHNMRLDFRRGGKIMKKCWKLWWKFG